MDIHQPTTMPSSCNINPQLVPSRTVFSDLSVAVLVVKVMEGEGPSYGVSQVITAA